MAFAFARMDYLFSNQVFAVLVLAVEFSVSHVPIMMFHHVLDQSQTILVTIINSSSKDVDVFSVALVSYKVTIS